MAQKGTLPAEKEILALHRELVSTPSVSGEEAAVQEFLEQWLQANDVRPERVGDSLLAMTGEGPVVLLNTHYDTVPPCSGWSQDPHEPLVEEGKVTGLGANDAKASVAAMSAAFVTIASEGLPVTLALGVAAGEETNGHGTEALLAELEKRGQKPVAAIVGEPTMLDVAIAQKGLLILELVSNGTACHAAHGERLGAANAIRRLSRDLVSVERVDLGEDHDLVGGTSLEPTMIEGGTARNVIPEKASSILDLRTSPVVTHDELIERIEKAVRGQVNVISKRLVPRETDREDPIVKAAVEARPDAKLFGSATMSDMVFMEGIPSIKCGPGDTERSHTPDEYVMESEILDGARFYADLIRAYAARAWDGGEGAA